MEKYFNIKPLVPKGKKAMGLGDIYPIILAIALVAILIAIVMFILGEFGEAWKDQESESVVNESLGAVFTTTNQTVAYSTRCQFNDMVVSAVTNLSNGNPIGSTNYTTYSNGNIINATANNYTDHLWNVSYTYEWGGKPCEVTVAISNDFTDFIPWIGIILLVVAAAIVLGILVRSFSGSGRV